MIYETENWGFSIDPDTGDVIQPTLPVLEDGDSCIGCNIVQFSLTPVFSGVNNLSFIGCNLINCDLPNDAEVYKSNTAINEYEVLEDV